MNESNSFLTPKELSETLGNITVHGIYKSLKTQKLDIITTQSRRKRIPPLAIRSFLEERGFQYPRKNISFQIVKGGVGKTSLSYALGLRASHYSAKVLLTTRTISHTDKRRRLTQLTHLIAQQRAVCQSKVTYDDARYRDVYGPGYGKARRLLDNLLERRARVNQQTVADEPV